MSEDVEKTRVPFAVRFSGGIDTVIDTEWISSDADVFEEFRRHGYTEFFTLGGDAMGYLNDYRRGDVHASLEGEISAAVWAYDKQMMSHLPTQDPYIVVIEACFSIRMVFCPTLTDLFTFCNLIAPTMRLNFETYPLVERGNEMSRQRANR